MKFLSTKALAIAVLASATLAAASLESGSGAHVPAHAHNTVRRDVMDEKAPVLNKRKKHGSRRSSQSGSEQNTSDDEGGESSKESSNYGSSEGQSAGNSAGSGRSMNLKHKQGLAWPNSNGISIKNFLVGDIDWYYSWRATPGWDKAPTDKVFCPMLWGDKGHGGNVQQWKKEVLQNPNGKYNKHKCMLGPNEVNQKGQSEMSVGDACKLMRQNMMPLADKGWYFIGPSTTSAPNGLDWYKKFKKECSDVFHRFDAIQLHYYDTKVEGFKHYVENWHKTLGKDIWVTEFACQNFNGGAQCSKGDAWNMLKQMSAWFEQQDYVKAYSPFGAMQNLQGVSEVNRLSQGSNPTSLFRMFAGM